MSVGADAMQRRAGIPASITFILQSLIVLLVLAQRPAAPLPASTSPPFRGRRPPRPRADQGQRAHERESAKPFFISFPGHVARSRHSSSPAPYCSPRLGEIFAERSGILNLGIEGTLLLGALSSYLISISVGGLWLPLFAAMLTGLCRQSLPRVDVRHRPRLAGRRRPSSLTCLRWASRLPVYRRSLAHAAPGPIRMFEAIHIPWLSGASHTRPQRSSVRRLLLYLTLVPRRRLRTSHSSTPASASPCGPLETTPRAADAGRHLRAAHEVLRHTHSPGAPRALAGGYLVLAQIGLFRDLDRRRPGFSSRSASSSSAAGTLGKRPSPAMIFGACDAPANSRCNCSALICPKSFCSRSPTSSPSWLFRGSSEARDARPATLAVPYEKGGVGHVRRSRNKWERGHYIEADRQGRRLNASVPRPRRQRVGMMLSAAPHRSLVDAGYHAIAHHHAPHRSETVTTSCPSAE